ncbi:MAG: peroxiredoxin family protein [Acidobacteriota bacterium]
MSSVEFIRFYARFANLYPLQTGTTTWQDDWTAAYLDLDSGFIWRSTGWDAQSESLVGGYYTYYVREQDDFGTPGWAYFAGMPVVYHETDYRTCNIFGGGCTTHTGAIEVWTNNFRGPYNEWSHTLNSDIPIGSCPSTFGGDLGDPAANFTRVDQNGDDVELCQFYDRVIVLLFVSGMCGSCHGQAIALQEYWEEYGDEGLLPIAVITADNFDNDPSEEYVADYASSYELTYPVVGDVDEGVFETYYDPWEGEPNTVIADRDMTVDRIDTCVLEGLCASAFDRAVDLL